MKTLFKIGVLLLLLFAIPARGATGDITGVAVETNGFQVLVYVSGLSTNGTYNLGLQTAPTNWLYTTDGNRVFVRTGGESLRVRVTSPGFDTNGNPVSRMRWATATRQMRLPYPNDASTDEVYDGSTIRLKFVLDWPIYAGDTVNGANILAGLYTQGTPSAAATGIAVTNNSVLQFPKSIANWTWPGFQRETNSTMGLRMFGSAPFAQDGMPLASVDFVVSDEAGTTTTNKAVFGFDPELRTLDRYPIAEWYAQIPLAPFAITNALRCDFVAYPWIGTTNEVLRTSAQPWAYPHVYPCSLTNLNDRTSVYSDQIAVVATTGNDTNGRATNASPANVLSSHYFLTIAGANQALAGTNSFRHGHADSGGGIIYVKSGVDNFPGAAVSGVGTNVPKSWVTIRPYPGDTVVLTNRTSANDLNDRIKFDGTGGSLTWGFVGTVVPFNNVRALWAHDITINSSGTAPLQGAAQDNICYLTHSRVTNFVQGLQLFPGQKTYWAILRGNNLDGFSQQITYFTALGNYKTGLNGSNYTLRTSTLNYSADWSILYGNRFLGHGGNSDCAVIGATLGVTNGLVVAQNIWQYTSSNVNPNLVFVCTGAGVPSTNIMVFHNLIASKRAGMGYNDSGTTPTPKWIWLLNNINEIPGFKSDTFPFGGGNSNRTGNWQLQFGVGCSGNVFPNRNVDQAAGQFAPDFVGFYSWFGGSTVGKTNATNWPRFVNDQGYLGAGFAAGGGDYRLTADSPFLNLNTSGGEWILKFDIDGNPRGKGAPPGPFSTAVPTTTSSH
jgi:hypothetical protein